MLACRSPHAAVRATVAAVFAASLASGTLAFAKTGGGTASLGEGATTSPASPADRATASPASPADGATPSPASPGEDAAATSTRPKTPATGPSRPSDATASGADKTKATETTDDAEPVVEVITLNPEAELDRQRYAVGISAGGGWMTNSGSGPGAGLGSFGIALSFGLGRGGARVPWTLQPYASFAITGASLSSESTVHPNRFTEFGARVMYRFSGALAHQWVSLGPGIAWTSRTPSQAEVAACLTRTGQSAPAQCRDAADISPAFVLDLGFGAYEITTRIARFGLGVRAPVQLSAYPGIGVIAFFYGELGLDR